MIFLVSTTSNNNKNILQRRKKQQDCKTVGTTHIRFAEFDDQHEQHPERVLLDVERFQHVIEDVPIFGQQLSRLEQILHQLPEVTLGTGPEGEKKTRSNSQFGSRPGSGRLTGAAHRPDVVHVMFQRRCHLVSCQRGCPRNTDKKKKGKSFSLNKEPLSKVAIDKDQNYFRIALRTPNHTRHLRRDANSPKSARYFRRDNPRFSRSTALGNTRKIGCEFFDRGGGVWRLCNKK